MNAELSFDHMSKNNFQTDVMSEEKDRKWAGSDKPTDKALLSARCLKMIRMVTRELVANGSACCVRLEVPVEAMNVRRLSMS